MSGLDACCPLKDWIFLFSGTFPVLSPVFCWRPSAASNVSCLGVLVFWVWCKPDYGQKQNVAFEGFHDGFFLSFFFIFCTSWLWTRFSVKVLMTFSVKQWTKTHLNVLFLFWMFNTTFCSFVPNMKSSQKTFFVLVYLEASIVLKSNFHFLNEYK